MFERIASTISDTSDKNRAPVSPSDELPVGPNATDNNKVPQNVPPGLVSRPSPNRPPSPASDKTANERMQDLMKCLERARLEEAVRKARENSTLPMSMQTKDTVPDVTSLDPSVRTVPSPLASVVESASPATPDTPNASLPSSLVQSGTPLAGPPLPGALNPDDVARLRGRPDANDVNSTDADGPPADDIAEVADDGASPPDGGDARSATGDDSGNDSDSGNESAAPSVTDLTQTRTN